MGGGILFLSRKFCKLSPPPRPDSLSLTQISRGRGDSSSKRKVSAKILLGKLKEKAEENNQKLKSYFLCWALKFHKYFIIVCYMYSFKYSFKRQRPFKCWCIFHNWQSYIWIFFHWKALISNYCQYFHISLGKCRIRQRCQIREHTSLSTVELNNVTKFVNVSMP